MAELIYDEVQLFGVCLLLGMRLAFFYDIVRIVRLFIRHKDWIIDIEDLVFWLFTAWQVFETLFRYNRGALRAYAFLGMFLGVLVYMLTISRLLLKLAQMIVPYWKKILYFCSKPLGSFRRYIRKMLKNVSSQVKMAMKSR